ncbi:MAG: RNA-binding protein [Acidobacteria bacterium]|nr:MAG: RNA-binding protein [Acidobacteriota bacterium]
MGKKLYVGNIPFTTGEAELETLFATAGAVESVKVVRDGQTGQPRGFAFVEMVTDADAANAIAKLHEHSMGGRSIAVNEARPKPAFGGGGGGGRGNGGGGGGRGRDREPRW